MKRFYDRIRQIWSDPGYRTRLAFFFVLGIALVLFIYIQDPSANWLSYLKDFVAIFLSIPLVQFLWDFLGGDPTENRLSNLHDDVLSVKAESEAQVNRLRQEFQSNSRETAALITEKAAESSRQMDELKRSLRVMADLKENNLGIERIWKDRRTWDKDLDDGVTVWMDRLTKASEIDLLSNTLWQSWMRAAEFRQALFRNVANGAHLRIVVYEPESQVMYSRAEDEKDMGKGQEMNAEILSALSHLATNWDELDEAAKKRVEIRLTYRFVHFAQIIRADDRILVANYLSGSSGGPSPTMQILGPKTEYFKKYQDQFKIVWDRAKVVSQEILLGYLSKYGEVKSPKPEL